MIQGIGSASSPAAGLSSSAAGTQSSSQGMSAAEVRKQVNGLTRQFPKLSVSISPAFIDKMAKDPAAAAKGKEMLDGIPAAQKWLENSVRGTGSELVSSGFSIGPDGNMSSWSVVRTAGGSAKTPDKPSDKTRDDAVATRQKKLVGGKAGNAWQANENLFALIEKNHADTASVRPTSNMIDLVA